MHRRHLVPLSSSQTWHSCGRSTPVQRGNLAQAQTSLHFLSGYKVFRTSGDQRNTLWTKQQYTFKKLCLCYYKCTNAPLLFVVSSQQSCLKRGSSVWEPDDDLHLLVAVSPALWHQAKTWYLPTGGQNEPFDYAAIATGRAVISVYSLSVCKAVSSLSETMLSSLHSCHYHRLLYYIHLYIYIHSVFLYYKVEESSSFKYHHFQTQYTISVHLITVL